MALLHPLLIAPLVVQIPHHRRGSRRLLLQQANGISLVHAVSVTVRFDVELVKRPMVRARYKSLPDARGSARIQAVRLRIPSIKVSNHRDRARIRRPHAEDCARLSLMRGEMRPHLVVDPIVAALVKEIEVVVGEKLRGTDSFGAHSSSGDSV